MGLRQGGWEGVEGLEWKGGGEEGRKEGNGEGEERNKKSKELK